MRYLIYFILFLFACNSGENYQNTSNLIDNNAQISVENNIFNFGEIIQGEKVTAQFTIKNTGSSDLIIVNVKTSCGCTAASWNKNPLNSGTEEVIEVTFNSENKIGKQEKTVSLLTNATPNTTILTIIGNVIVPEKN